MAATIALQPVRPVLSAVGQEPWLMEFPEAASQTFKRGEAVYLTTTGVAICAANPGKILGFAAEDGHNGTAGQYKIGVYIATPSTVFAGNLVTSGNANGNNAAPTGATTATALMGLSYGVNIDGTNHQTTVDTSNTGSSHERAVVIGMVESYGISDPSEGVLGDIGGRVLFTVMPAYSQLYMLSS